MGIKKISITIFKKYKSLFMGASIFLVCFISYGQILKMYFYLEDYLILFSIKHPNSPEAGYGSGILGRPYGWAVTPFIPFYYVFGLNPFGYYFIEIILYFIAALVVFLFARTITNNKKIALGSAFIFASGYIGSDSMYRLAVGWQNILAGILISLSAIFYYKYTQKPSLKSYTLALGIYLFTSEFSFYRSQGILALILATEILFNFNLKKTALRIIPFAISYWYFYIYSLIGVMDQTSKFRVLIQKIWIDKNYELLLTPLKTLENIFIPSKLNFPLTIFLTIFITISFWKRSRKY